MIGKKYLLSEPNKKVIFWDQSRTEIFVLISPQILPILWTYAPEASGCPLGGPGLEEDGEDGDGEDDDDDYEDDDYEDEDDDDDEDEDEEDDDEDEDGGDGEGWSNFFLISTYMIALALHCTKKLTPRTNIARGFHKSGVWSLAYLTLILEYSEFPWIDAMPLNNSINVAVIVT